MDSVSKYGFINAKIRAKIGLMHEGDLMEKLIAAPSLIEAIGIFKNTKFEYLYDIYDKTGDLELLELSLLKQEVDLYKYIGKNLDSETAKFINVLGEKIELDNVKNAIRIWFSSLVLDHQIAHRSEYIYKDKIFLDVDYSIILNALSYSAMIKGLIHTPYYEVLKKYDHETISKNGLFKLEIDLDHLYFERVLESTTHLSKVDRQLAEKILAIDIDLKNILQLIRYSFLHHLTKEDLIHVFIPHGTIHSKILKDLDTFTYDKCRSTITKLYPTLVSSFVDIEGKKDVASSTELCYSTLKIEHYLAKRRKQEYAHLLVQDPFSIGIILTYLFLYRNENQMIRSILTSKYYNRDPEDIRRGLS